MVEWKDSVMGGMWKVKERVRGEDEVYGQPGE